MNQLRMSPEAFDAHQKRVKGGSFLAALDHTAEVAEKKAVRKFGNVKVEFDGEVFDSIRELARYKELLLIEKSGQIKNLRTKISYEITPFIPATEDRPSQRATYFIPDFSYDEFFKGKWRAVCEDTKYTTAATGDAKKSLKATSAYKLFRLKAKLLYVQKGIFTKEV
jgi:hypothetical protein